jgi:hypothetical protein
VRSLVLFVDMLATGLQIAFLMSLDVIVSLLEVPSNTSGQFAPSHATAQTSIDRVAVGLVPVVTLPDKMKSVNPSVVLSITLDSMPANRFVSLARLATAQVSVVLLPYLIRTLLGITHPLQLPDGH